MSLAQRQDELATEFARLPDWEARYKRLIAMGKELQAYPEQYRSEDYKVKGCQAQVWLYAKFNEQGQVEFAADSDALIVKGLAAVLLRIYSCARPEEILSAKPDFLQKMGLENHLSPSRANGLYSMIRQILYYATAFQAAHGN